VIFVPSPLVGVRYPVDAADFDGTDYMSRGAGLSGAADGKKGIFSGWVRLDGGDGVAQSIIDIDGTAAIARRSTNDFRIIFENAAGADQLDIQTAGTYLAGATWLNVLASWDMATAGARHLYINDVSDISVNAFVNDTLDYTKPDWFIGSSPTPSFFLNGCLAELYFNTVEYLDFSVAANRRKFIDSNRKPVDLGADGSRPTGTAPIIYQRVARGASPSTFATNLGSGGNFTITGTLTAGSTSPSD